MYLAMASRSPAADCPASSLRAFVPTALLDKTPIAYRFSGQNSSQFMSADDGGTEGMSIFSLQRWRRMSLGLHTLPHPLAHSRIGASLAS